MKTALLTIEQILAPFPEVIAWTLGKIYYVYLINRHRPIRSFVVLFVLAYFLQPLAWVLCLAVGLAVAVIVGGITVDALIPHFLNDEERAQREEEQRKHSEDIDRKQAALDEEKKEYYRAKAEREELQRSQLEAQHQMEEHEGIDTGALVGTAAKVAVHLAGVYLDKHRRH